MADEKTPEEVIEPDKKTKTLELDQFDHIIVVQRDGSVKMIVPLKEDDTPLCAPLVSLMTGVARTLVSLIEQNLFHPSNAPERVKRKDN